VLRIPGGDDIFTHRKPPMIEVLHYHGHLPYLGTLDQVMSTDTDKAGI
jgi:hypothetical protein